MRSMTRFDIQGTYAVGKVRGETKVLTETYLTYDEEKIYCFKKEISRLRRFSLLQRGIELNINLIELCVE